MKNAVYQFWMNFLIESNAKCPPGAELSFKLIPLLSQAVKFPHCPRFLLETQDPPNNGEHRDYLGNWGWSRNCIAPDTSAGAVINSENCEKTQPSPQGSVGLFYSFSPSAKECLPGKMLLCLAKNKTCDSPGKLRGKGHQLASPDIYFILVGPGLLHVITQL